MSRYGQTMVPKSTGVLAAALLAVTIWATQASALPVTYDGIAADGHLAVFSTAEQMVPGDTDHEQDVYVRAFDAGVGEYVTREVSIGPLGGNDAYPAQYDGVSSDGSKVFFSSKEPLVSGDGDKREDVYVRNLNTNTTMLVSQGDSSCGGEGCGNGAADSSFVPGGVVPSGERLFFATTEKLSSADGDGSLDVYMRDLASGKTVLVSQGAASCAGSNCGNGPQPAIFEQASSDGEKVVFTSTEGLVAGDEDGRVDIYQRDLGTETTKLVSIAGTCPALLPEQTCDPTFGGASSDGSHVFFESNERIAPADEDSSQDVYDWSGSGPAALASTGASGGNGAFNATYSGTAGATGAVFFETSEALDPAADKDSEQDVYERYEGATKLVSTGPEGRNGPAPASFQWVAPDASRAVFSTTEALTPDDTDTVPDVYERSGGGTTLISTGPEGGNGAYSAAFAGASKDGSHLFFVSAEQLVEEDEDESVDLYLRAGGETKLISTGPIGGNGLFSAGLRGVSADGSQAFFTTRERLTVDDDFANEEDVYSWTAGKNESTPATTLLVSVKNSSELALGPPPPFLEGTNPSSPAETTEPSLFGQAEAGATITIYTNSTCSGQSVPPGGTAEELAGEGIPVAVAPGTKKTFYATAELEGIVSPCSNGISYKQETATPPKEEGSGGGGGGGGGGGSGGGGTGSGGLDQLPTSSGNGGGIDFVTPETAITFGPASKTHKHKVVFRFDDATGQPGTNFVCKLDHRHWKGCRSPRWVKKLSFGRHVFAVKAVNELGVWDQLPAKRKFKVVR